MIEKCPQTCTEWQKPRSLWSLRSGPECETSKRSWLEPKTKKEHKYIREAGADTSTGVWLQVSRYMPRQHFSSSLQSFQSSQTVASIMCRQYPPVVLESYGSQPEATSVKYGIEKVYISLLSEREAITDASSDHSPPYEQWWGGTGGGCQ